MDDALRDGQDQDLLRIARKPALDTPPRIGAAIADEARRNGVDKRNPPSGSDRRPGNVVKPAGTAGADRKEPPYTTSRKCV